MKNRFIAGITLLSSISISAGELPYVASVSVPVITPKSLAQYISDYRCLDESECFGDTKLDRAITLEYKDIATIKPSKDDLHSDDTPEDRAYTFLSHHLGLYFTKSIKLANGQFMFDFIKSCSRKGTLSEITAIQDIDEVGTFTLSVPMYFKMIGETNVMDMSALFTVIDGNAHPQSNLFAQSILTDPDFMKSHGVECAK